MKTWKGQEFEGEWLRANLAWVEGGRVGERPAWQTAILGDVWPTNGSTRMPDFDARLYRWAPKPKRTVTINGKVLVAPETEAPVGVEYFVVVSENIIYSHPWCNNKHDRSWLAAGNVFLTQEDAQAMADWLVKCRRGET